MHGIPVCILVARMGCRTNFQMTILTCNEAQTFSTKESNILVTSPLRGLVQLPTLGCSIVTCRMSLLTIMSEDDLHRGQKSRLSRDSKFSLS